MEKIYSRTKTIQEDKVSGFCPGCMHSTVVKLIGEALEDNENEIFDENYLRYISNFTKKTVRLRDDVELLRGSVVHLQDAYQSFIDLKTNHTMQIFTVVSTIFFPLTVIVGWYGMNFKYMPEIQWRYGYVFVIALSVIVVTVLAIIGKKKKWIG